MFFLMNTGVFIKKNNVHSFFINDTESIGDVLNQDVLKTEKVVEIIYPRAASRCTSTIAGMHHYDYLFRVSKNVSGSRCQRWST